jgi:hypothetical protein
MKSYQTVAVQRVRDIVSTGRIMKLTHAEIYSRADAALAGMPKRMTVSERTYARGYLHALMDSLWSETEFCYRNSSGVLFSTHKESAHRRTEEFYSSGRGVLLGEMESAHVWKGTDKPFTDWAFTCRTPAPTIQTEQGV